jgi:pimeloyl-ACP methyl ester carboxylesterase
MSAFETVAVEANDVQFQCLATGSGPLALCLHGFPDTAHTWRHLMPALAEAGYRAVAPFLRGYAPTSVAPDGRYQVGALALDVISLHDRLGGTGDAVLVGHDWGAVVAYPAAAYEPDRWSRVITLAVPPAGAMGAAFITNVDQLKRSWYMFFFQHPLSDLIVPGGDLALIDRIWSDWSPGYDAAEDLAHLKDSLRDPAHLTAALSYYRAAFGTLTYSPDATIDAIQAMSSQVPPQPLLYLHGADDGCIGAEVVDIARHLVGPNVTIEVVPDAGHFLHLEQPHLINTRILEFIA